MKIIKVLFLLLFCLSWFTLYAQEQNKPLQDNKTADETKGKSDNDKSQSNIQSLFGNVSMKGVKLGGYGALDVRGSKFCGGYGLLNGGQGGFIFNHNLIIGGAGYGLTSGNKVRSLTDKKALFNERVDIGYGGLLLKYHFFPDKMVNFSVGVLTGVGGLMVGSPFDRRNHYDNINRFFITEPELYVYMNIFSRCRLGIGGSYKLVSGMKKRGVTNGDFNGFSIGATVQCGVF